MKSGIQARFLTIMAIAGLLCSCSGKRFDGFAYAPHPEFIWPAPPEQPRVAYVASITNHEDLYTVSGGFGGLARIFAGPADSRLMRPYAIALHPDGGLLIADPGRNIVHFYDWKSRRYVAIGEELPGLLPSPVGVVALPGGDILVADSKTNMIHRFDRKGNSAQPFAAAGSIGRPAGLAVNPSTGEVFAADVVNHCIAVFDVDGRLLRTIGTRGSEPGQFNFPTHLSIDEAGNVLVADSMNFRVQRIGREGEWISTYGELGNSPGTFAKPKGVAGVGGGKVAVVEGLYDAVQLFNTGGELLLSIGQPGSEPGQFWLPAGITVDRAQGILYVADSYNSRVQVFRIMREDANE